ncbi:hypothetical protein RI129_003448 [Pyrocoelia pectoralis]|uniref:Gustatory receptor n=1 Tax=Pyrocoelia pectoralis TaxID=417401 RepID=A0AAN7VQ81_9COLE
MGDLFFKYFKFTLYVYKIFGVENFYAVSRLKNFTNVLWNLPLLLLFFFSVWKLRNIKELKDDCVMTDTDQLVVFTATLHTVGRILYSRRKNVPDLLKEIDDINKDLNIDIRHKKRRWVILCSEIIIPIGYLLMSVPYGDDHIFYVNLVFSISSCGSFMEVYFVHQVIKLICGQYQDINVKLRNHYNRISSESEYGPMVNTSKVVSKKKEIDRIVNIASNHYRITKVAKCSNSTFNVHVLLACVSSFIALTTGIHYSLSVMFTGLRNNEDNDVFISSLMGNGLWIICYSFLFIFIIKPWRDLHNEAKKTATYIHDIWNKYANANAVDANINHLQLISLQLLNTKLEFTAYGFFSLDWTLLHAIISAVTTYVVILIQFETT